jgi:hypothetical protein
MHRFALCREPICNGHRFPAPDGKLPVEVPRFVRRTVHRREDEPVLLPGPVGAITVGGLPVGAELEGGYADVRKRQYSGRAWRFGLTVTKLMIGPLKLPPHVDFSGLEADRSLPARCTADRIKVREEGWESVA